MKSKGKDEIHGVTKFSDLTQNEFSEQYLGAFNPVDAPLYPVVNHFPVRVDTAVTGAYNLADDNLLTAVKDQAQCGSCWAFATTECLESAHAMAGHDLIELSPQQLVSCDNADGNSGCQGGWPSAAMQYTIENGGLASEADYPYTSGRGRAAQCKSPVPAPSGGDAKSWAYAQPACQSGAACVEDSDALANAIHSFGGIAIAIDASSFNSYTGGIITNDSCSSSPASLDHAIQVVGYDTTGPTPYWIVRNSWNTGWGEDGFIRFAMGDNTCGIANVAAVVSAMN